MFWHTRRSGVSKARRATPFLVLVAVAAAIGGFSTIGGANTGGGSGPLGAYAGALAPGSVSSFGRSIGQQPAFAMDFLNGSSWSTMVDSAPTYMSTWSGSGYKMVWGVPILPNSFRADSNPSDTSGSAYGLEQGAAGAYNSYFLKLAQEMVAGGQGSSIVRPGWEFNGNWFPWAAKGAAASFVGYWQQIVNTMRSVPGQDFKFEWNPSAGDQGVGDLADFYPGSAYVDYIGLDLYDQSWATYPGIAAEWNTYLTEPYGLNWLASFAASEGKPITLPEWGLDPDPSTNDGGQVSHPGSEVGGGDNPTFINDMAKWISQNNVYEATYWEYGSSLLSHNSNPNSFAAFVSDFGPGSGIGSGSTTTTTSPSGTTTTTTTTPPTTTTTTTVGGNTGNTGGSGNSGNTGNTGSGGSGGSGSGGSEMASSMQITNVTPLVTSKKAEFAAAITVTQTGAVGPPGRVSWKVLSASGARVACPSTTTAGDRANGVAKCAVPPGQIAAAAGPYKVSAYYSGGDDVAPSADTIIQHVARANSVLTLRVTPKLLPGRQVLLAATVKGGPTSSSTPTGTTTFSVWGTGGQGIPCIGGGGAVSLQYGTATCVIGGGSVHGPYYFKVTYSGDPNFDAIISRNHCVTVSNRSASFIW